MNKINELFNGWADKLPIDFFKGNFSVLGFDISRLFVLSVAVLIILFLIVIIVAVTKKKKDAPEECVIPLLCEEPEQAANPLSAKPIKSTYVQSGLHKAVATPDYEDVLLGEDAQLELADEAVDLDQLIIGDMNDSARAAMLDEFDFDMDIDALCDFDTVLSDEDEEDSDDDADEDITPYVVAKKKGKKPEVRYERSFLARLIQTTSNNKARYNVIKNVFMSYHKVRNSISWGCESFIHGRNQIARIYFIGKTMRLFLALKPADYDISIYHQEDKSDTSKYKSVPMMIKIKSRLGLRRAISLIMDLANKYSLVKTKRMEIIDYIAANPYQEDNVLLSRGLIRLEDPNKYLIAADDATTPDATAKNDKAQKELIKESKSKGKYEFLKKADGVHFLLYANNGELLTKNINPYTTVQGAKRGISTFKNAVSDGEFVIDKDNDKYRFVLKTKSARLVFIGEPYDNKADAEKAIKKVKAFADTAIMIE